MKHTTTVPITRAAIALLTLAQAGPIGCAEPLPGDPAYEMHARAVSLDPTKLRVGFWGSNDRRVRTEKAAALFTAATGIGVELEHYIPTQGAVNVAYWPTMNQHEPAHTLPDVMQHDYAFIEEWTRREAIIPLDSYVADGTLNLSDVPAPMVDGGRVGGALMGVSLGTNTQAVVIDLDAFAAANIPVPRDSWTWKDFEAIALRLHKRLGIFGAGGSFHGYTPGWKAVYLSNGDWVFSPDGKALGYKEKDDKLWVDHWKMLLKLKRQGALPRLDQEPTGSGVESMLIVTRQAAMDHLHSNQLVAMWTAANAAGTPRNFKLLPLPRIDDCSLSPVYIKPSQYFSITRDTTPEKRAIAARFISFITNDIPANLELQGERGVPIANAVLAALKPVLSVQARESFELIGRAASYATTLPPNDPPRWTEILTTVFTPKVERPIMNEEITPKAGVKLFRTEATAILARP
jgi:multiple sugar transport system substrate-binding protein